MLHFQGTPSPTKSIPGLVSASASGLTIHEQPIRFGADVYQVPETSIPIAYDGEDTTYRVALCNGPSGAALVLVEGDAMPAGYAEVCYLVRFRLANASDTPETVDVEAVRRTCTTETPADVRRHTLPAEVVTPAETPERAARRAQRVRVDTLRRGIAQKPIAEMSLAELRWVVALMAETMGIDLGDGASAPKGRAP